MADQHLRAARIEREREERLNRNARRFFFDVEEEGSVILSAPNRTAFDERFDFPMLRGESNVAGDPLAMSRLSSLSGAAGGFHASFEFGGRVFFVNVQSVPKETIEK